MSPTPYVHRMILVTLLTRAPCQESNLTCHLIRCKESPPTIWNDLYNLPLDPALHSLLVRHWHDVYGQRPTFFANVLLQNSVSSLGNLYLCISMYLFLWTTAISLACRSLPEMLCKHLWKRRAALGHTKWALVQRYKCWYCRTTHY